MMVEQQSTEVRHIALDAHKRYGVFLGVNGQAEVVLTARRVDWTKLESWIKVHLRTTDIVIIEATTNTWHLYDLIEPHVAKVKIANAGRVKLLGAGGVKTDSRDALHLARLSAANLLPEVWVPPVEIRELRQLVAHRSRLIKQHSMFKNRLSAVLQRHAIVPPEGALFQAERSAWWHALKLGAMEMLRIRQDWQQLQALTPLIQAVNEQIVANSQEARYVDAARLLIQLPEINALSAMTLIAAIGDITRFASASQLVGYSGLGARVHESGEVKRNGAMSKAGRSDIRTVMIEAAWTAVNSKHPFWAEEYKRLSHTKLPSKAIGAIARRLLVAVWHVWSKAEADRHAVDQKVATSFLIWGQKLKKAGRKRLTTADFIRKQLDALGLGKDLNEIPVGQNALSLRQVEPMPKETTRVAE